MDRIRDSYINDMHLSPDRFERDLMYLTQLATRSAIEIDRHIQGNGVGLENVQDLSDLLARKQLPDTASAFSYYPFPYDPLLKAIEKNSNIEFDDFPRLALHMRLLRYELDDIQNNPDRQKQMLNFVVNFGQELLKERNRISTLREEEKSRYGPRRMVA